MTFRKVLGALIIAFLLGVATWWWLSLSRDTDVRTPANELTGVSIINNLQSPLDTSTKIPDRGSAMTAETAGDLLADERLTSREVKSGLAKMVLSPSRKDSDRDEALSHLLHLIERDDEPVWMDLGRDAALSPKLARRLFENAFNRGHALQVDIGLLLLERRDMAALHEDVHEHMLFLLGPDIAADSDLVALKRAADVAKKRWIEQATP